MNNEGKLFLLRIYKSDNSDEMKEYLLESVDVETAIFNLEKSFDKKFKLIEDGEIPVLEEIKL